MIDQIIVGLYLVITLIIGLYVGRNVKSVRDFAVGRRDFSTLVLVSAVFASVVDASCTVGLAGNTFSTGPILVLAYTGVSVSRFILAYFIAPKMTPFMDSISSGDIFERLYGTRAKTLMGVSTLIECTLMTGSQILAISHILRYFFDIQELAAVLGAATVIIFYSFRGGIRSVTATDVFQFAIMLIAIPIVCGIGIAKIGGVTELWTFIKAKGLFIEKASINDYGKHLAIFISMALPCLYPMCVQRMLMAKNPQQIKRTFLINGVLSLPFYIITGLIGIITLALMPRINPNFAFPALISEILPIGVKGFVIAGLLAIFMSTVDSILNTGAIATAHDLIGSLIKKPLKEKTELLLIKLSSLTIATGAIFIALQFSNVLDVMFFVMVIGNSVFFPGYLIGILANKTNQKAFWIGVGVGVVTVMFCFFMLKMYPLYVMLIAISANTSVHGIFFVKDKFTKNRIKTIDDSRRQSKSKSNTTTSPSWVKNLDYCKIFAGCIIAISVLPYFTLTTTDLSSAKIAYLSLNAITAILSFLIIFHELWWGWIYKYLDVLWGIVLFLAFPVQSIAMLLMENFSLPWLLDALLTIPILATITHRRGAIAYSILMALSLGLFAYLGGENFHSYDRFGYWSFTLHLIALALCLFLFRKRDVELCKFAGSSLIHETARYVSSFEGMLTYLQPRLPVLIAYYRDDKTQFQSKTLTESELFFLSRIPEEALIACLKTKALAKSFALRITKISHRKHFEELCSIRECVADSLDDPTIKAHRSKFVVESHDDIVIFGDKSQLIQVFVNIFENALFATKDSVNPMIKIIIRDSTLSIEDNGVGIHSSILPSIFDELFSTKGSHGQGLAFCKDVVVEHGGTISCTSERNKFTRFDFKFLPIKMGTAHV